MTVVNNTRMVTITLTGNSMQDVIDAVGNTAECRWLFEEVGVAAFLNKKFFLSNGSGGAEFTLDEEHLARLRSLGYIE